MYRFCFLLVFVGLLSTHGFSQVDKIKSELAQADKLINDKNYAEALKHIDAALDIDPLYIESLEKKLSVMLQNNQEKEITKQIEDWIAYAPQQPEYFYIRGVLFLYKQKPQKAIDDFENAVYYQIPEKYMDKIYLNRGMAYYNLGKFPEAESDFSNAVDINPKYSAAYHSWGMLKYEQQDYEEAVNLFNKALQLEEDNPVIYYNLGMTYVRLKDLNKACYYFNKSCTLGYKNACKFYLLQCGQ
jgi:tetratricopeptide (TPR) repeat protein